MQVRLVEWLRAAQLLDVFGCFLLQHFGGVVRGDDAQQASIGIEHGHCQETVVREQTGGRFLVRVGAHGQRLAIGDLADGRVRWREHQVAQAQDAEQPLVRIGDVDVVDRLGFARDAADRGQRFVGGQVGRNGDDLAGHQAGGAVGRIGQQGAHFVGVFRLHLDQNGFGVLVWELVDDVGGIVGVHLFEHVGGVGTAQSHEQPGGVAGVEVLQYLGSALIAQQRDSSRELRWLQRMQPAGDSGSVRPTTGGAIHGTADQLVPQESRSCAFLTLSAEFDTVEWTLCA